jgi:hypothetical protein
LNQNDTGDTKVETTTVVDVGAGQPQGENDQPQASSSTTPPQPRQDVLNKGKTKETNGNGGSGAAKRQRNKSRSGQSTPKLGSKPASDDEGENSPSTGQRDNSTKSMPTAQGKRLSLTIGSPADTGTGDTKAGSTAGNNSNQQASLAQNQPPSTADATQRSVTFDQSPNENKKGESASRGAQGAGTTPAGNSPEANPNPENSDTATVDTTNANRTNHAPEQSPENTQPVASPSTDANPNPTTFPSPLKMPTLDQALKLRSDAVALDERIKELKVQQKKAATTKRQDGTAPKNVSLDDAIKEKEALNKRITRIAGMYAENSSLGSY